MERVRRIVGGPVTYLYGPPELIHEHVLSISKGRFGAQNLDAAIGDSGLTRWGEP